MLRKLLVPLNLFANPHIPLQDPPMGVAITDEKLLNRHNLSGR